VWIDGDKVAHFAGRLGYVGRYYWKFGVYRESASEAIAVQYANMEVGTTSLATRIKHPKPVYASSSNGPMPHLPLQAGARMIGLGDSMVRVNHAAPGSTQMSSYGVGQLVWARALDPRFVFDTWPVDHDPVGNRGFNGANQGVDGDHTVAVRGGVPGVLSRIPYVLARKPAIVYLQVGTNDINSHETAASVEWHLDQILHQLRAANVWVVLSTIWPRVTAGGVAPWPVGDQRWRTRNAVNTWINAQRGRDGVRVVDPNPSLIDKVAPSGEEEWRPGYSIDGVHPAPPAAYSAARAIDAVLVEMISSGSAFATDPGVANLLPDGALVGTRGAKSAGISGAVANDWSAVLSGGDAGAAVSSTVEASKEVGEDRLDQQLFVIQPGNDGSATPYHTLAWTYTPDIAFTGTGVTDGDWVQAAVHLDISAWDAWVNISMNLLLCRGRDAIRRQGSMRPYDPLRQRWPDSAWKGWLLGDPIRIPPGTGVDSIRTSETFVEVAFDKAASGSGTIKLSRPIIRKVPDPSRLWNLEP
jgi:lysophospholipase L1-like esterase